MRVLLTGANGYIGRRLITPLQEMGHEVLGLVRSPRRMTDLPVVVGDLIAGVEFPEDIDVAFYLVHSMRQSPDGFENLEEKAANNFVEAIKKTNCKQIIFLGGLGGEGKLSPHLASRRKVEEILKNSGIPCTIFRAGIIVGSGSASFEIMRDLVEKLPVMVAPKWVKTRCQPIGISDVLFYLTRAVGSEPCYNQTFEIGGPDVLTYKEMLYQLAEARKLTRHIFTVPVLTPHLSSYWLLLITAANYSIAKALVESMRNEVICTERRIHEIFPHTCLSFKEAVGLAFTRIAQNQVVSSWRDALSTTELDPDLTQYIRCPSNGCFKNEVRIPLTVPREQALDKLWAIGGKNGWYRMDWAWRIRGRIDKLVGGVGLRRGRTHPTRLRNGDALDFWRVLAADKEHGRLLLYAEMKVPGEAWLEFEISETEIIQTATFRPQGLLGRLYWCLMLPFHKFIFKGMAQALSCVRADA